MEADTSSICRRACAAKTNTAQQHKRKNRSIQHAKSTKEGRTHLVLGTQHDDLGDRSERLQQLK
jgi:hypothetical protein